MDRLLLIFISTNLWACGLFGGDDDDKKNNSAPAVGPAEFFSSVATINVDVAYEVGAAPYTDTIGNAIPVWRVLQDNLVRLFAGRSSPPTLSVATELRLMQELPDQGQESWTGTEILDLATRSGAKSSSLSQANFWIVFLDGFYDRGGVVDKEVIGVSLTGTTIIAMFKPVIAQLEPGNLKILPRLVEQSTLVHEMGHALGLVNNGVPLVQAHHDAQNGAHCTAEQCVMYWLNEGKSDVIEFVKRFFAQNTFVMFDDLCLEDIVALSR